MTLSVSHHSTFGRERALRWRAAFCLLAGVGVASADVTLPPVFSDHALVQRSGSTAIWGRASAGERVELRLAGAQGAAVADADGRWRASLDLAGAGEGPHELVARGEANTVTVADVLIGEVWVCSGQSNMAWRLREAAGADAELARPENRRLRQFLTIKKTAAEPRETVEGRWIVASGEDRGLFTAAGYFFAAALQRELDLPVGLIDVSVGGTPIEPWMSFEAFEADAELRGARDAVLRRVAEYPARRKEYLESYRAWVERHARGGQPAARAKTFAHPKANTEGWREVTLPGRLADAGLPDAGAVWLRRTVRVTPDMAGLYLVLQLGELRGFHEVYWNGKLVAEATPETGLPRVVRITLPTVEEGEAVLAVRLFNPAGGLALGTAGRAFQAGAVSLGGAWLARAEFALPPLADAARAEYPEPPPAPPPPNDRPAQFYNSLIHPLTSYAVRGVLWYQGESNTGRAAQYRRAFPAMIADWRARWGRPELPFYWCQLAGYGALATEPRESAWAELREAQTGTLALPRTGQAVLIDLGEEADIHPREKREVGERLARIALADTYGREAIFSGPVFRELQIEGGTARVRFDHAKGGLAARPLPETYRPRSTADRELPLPRLSPASELQGFALRDEAGRWHWADARIEGADVLVTAPGVRRPLALRYAWADFPIGNLCNGEGLPAGPFQAEAPLSLSSR